MRGETNNGFNLFAMGNRKLINDNDLFYIFEMKIAKIAKILTAMRNLTPKIDNL